MIDQPMSEPSAEVVTLKATMERLVFMLATSVIFLLAALWDPFPQTIFYFAFRIIVGVGSLLGIAISAAGLFSDRYDATLSSEGVTFGAFRGKRHYRWSEVKAVWVLRETVGTRLCLELHDETGLISSERPIFRTVPDTYGMDPHELAKMLTWKARHSTGQITWN